MRAWVGRHHVRLMTMTESRPEPPELRHEKASAAVRVGVVLCVLVAGVAGVAKLNDALGVFDARADRNSSLGYERRTYPAEEWIAGDPAVLEAARLRIPPDAVYRVVTGSRFAQRGYSTFALYFSKHVLLPRRETASESAPWVLCYGCAPSDLDVRFDRFELLAGTPPGLIFGRVTR